MKEVLEYREFPTRKAISHIAFAPLYALLIRVISLVTQGRLFPGLSLQQHLVFLALGIAAAALTLAVTPLLIPRLRSLYVMMAAVGLFVSVSHAVLHLITLPPDLTWYYRAYVVVSAFGGLVLVMNAQTVGLNETVVIRYRGRIVGLLFALTLTLLFVYSALDQLGPDGLLDGISIREAVAMVGIIVSAVGAPWRWKRHPLTVAEDVQSYVLPTLFILVSYFLWYQATMLNIRDIFELAGETFISLGEFSGLAMYEPLFLALGVVVAGLLADLKGRKRAFDLLVLMMGMMAIFSTTLYGIESVEITPGTYEIRVILNAPALLVIERFIEGYMLCLFVMLIWSEVGSPKTRSKRIAMVWSFLLAYMTAFWVLGIGAFGIQPPFAIALYGREFAILTALVGLYLSANVPEVLGREVELESLSLDFDEELVEDTVEALVGSDEFESILSQLEVMNGTIETPDGPVNVMGEEFDKYLPLRAIPGIGVRMEERLKRAGYASAVQLAGETPARLAAKIDGLTRQRASKILAATRKAVKETLQRLERGDGSQV